MTPLLAHALHDSAALGVHPATIAVAAAGILTVAVVAPGRAEEARVALPEPVRVPVAVGGGPDGGAPAPSAPDDEADQAAGGSGVAVHRPGMVARVLAGVVVALLAGSVVVGLTGPRSPNLAGLLVANVVLPTTVLVGLLSGGPRPGPVAPSRPWPLTLLLLVAVALSHASGGNGGTIAGAVLGAYLVLTAVGRVRHGPGWWRHGDPLGVLSASVGRLAPLARDEQGRRRPWLEAAWDATTPTERLVVGVVLAAALARAARFVPAWQQTLALQPPQVRTVAAVALIAYVLALLALLDRGLRRRDGQGLTVAIVPVTAALVLANDLAPALFSVWFSGTLLSDPLGVGADLFGTADRTVSTALLASPLVWLWQLVAVLLGGALGSVVQRDLDRAAGRAGTGRTWLVAAVAASAVVVLLAG